MPGGLDSDGPRIHGNEKHLGCHPGLQVGARLCLLAAGFGPAAVALTLLCVFRHAIEVNKRDYRAWYGLGQTYEILKMPFYCLYYYRKAHQLRCGLGLGDKIRKLTGGLTRIVQFTVKKIIIFLCDL